jgi:hypothetical protein
MLRSAAFASDVVASIPSVFPTRRPPLARRSSREHPLVRLHVDQPTCPRNRRVIWRRLVQFQAEKAPDRQRVRRSPRHTTLRSQPFEVPHQHHPEVPPRGQTRPTHVRSVEPAARGLDERVEGVRRQNLIQTLIEGVARALGQVARRNPHRVLRSFPFLSHRHAGKLHYLPSKPDPFTDCRHGLLAHSNSRRRSSRQTPSSLEFFRESMNSARFRPSQQKAAQVRFRCAVYSLVVGKAAASTNRTPDRLIVGLPGRN